MFSYQSGFGNEFATEALPGALPPAQNSPQRCPYDLYAEQFSGTAFTAPRHANRRSWLYRIRPAVTHGPFQALDRDPFADQTNSEPLSPNQLRWDPPPLPNVPTDFVEGLLPIAGNGSPETHTGCGISMYVANRSMGNRFFYSADGELRVDAPASGARGYICENFAAPLELPDLGPIGSNGLANPRDFLTPHAYYEDRAGDCVLIAKFLGRLWAARMDHSPLDVVAWHGNNVPYKYDLRRFNAIGSISYDHPDPSIFLVLHSPSGTVGTSNLDFVVFPPRWLAMQNTFRPPWFHRNVASEYMGLIHGVYDAKSTGFVPGGASLHNSMSGHGPDAATFDKALAADTTQPQHITDTMAFMFESRFVLRPTRSALHGKPSLQQDYMQCWLGLDKRFDPSRP